jgi:hypothetical protein
MAAQARTRRSRKQAARKRPQVRKRAKSARPKTLSKRGAPARAAGGMRTAKAPVALEVERAAPSRPEVRVRVVAKLAAVVQQSPSSLRDDQRLWEDLGMSPLLRSAMAKSYTDITRSYGGLPVTLDEAGRLKTVGDSVDLVHRRSAGKH